MKKIKLLPKHIEKLEALPEQGMGYQLVDLELKSGMELKKRTVLNSSYLLLDEQEDLNSGDILEVRIHNE